MIKLVHKSHIRQSAGAASLTVYYSLSDIILGFLLIALVAFFVYSYVDLSLRTPSSSSYATAASSQMLPEPSPSK